jgi:hypothetical protein
MLERCLSPVWGHRGNNTRHHHFGSVRFQNLV